MSLNKNHLKMDFKKERISSLQSSILFLIESMLETCSYINTNKISNTKAAWAVQTEKFSSFFDRIKDNNEAISNFKNKVLKPVYDKHSIDIINRLIGDDDVVQDEYLKVTVDDDDSFKIRTQPRGISFKISNLSLSVSEVYTEAVNYSLSNKQENVPFPVMILIGFYSCIYFAILNSEPEDQCMLIKENINVLVESLEMCDKPEPIKRRQAPGNMLQNILGNIDLGQIGEMMGKVTGDKQASKEFGEVFGKMTEVIKSGGNPLDVMGDILKKSSINLSSEPSGKTDEDEEEATEVEATATEVEATEAAEPVGQVETQPNEQE